MANDQGVDYSQDMAAREGTEVAPGVNVPPGLTSPGIVQAPDQGAGTGLPGVPGAGIDLLSAQFLKHWLERTPAPGPSAPGSFGDKLRSAVNQVGAGLGDAASATENLAPGEGALGGVTRTLAARTKRLAGERSEAMKAAEFRQRSAMNNIEMATHIAQLQKENVQMQNTVFDSNKTAVKAREDAGWDVEHGVSELEARKRISNYKDDQGRHYTDLYEFIPTGYTEVNGKKIPQYDVVSKQERMVKPTEDEIKFIKQNGGPNLSPGMEVANTSLTSMRLAAQRTATARQGIEDSLGRKLSSDQMNAVKEALATKEVHDALAIDPADKVSGLQKASKMLDDGIKQHQILLDQAQKTGNQEAIQEAQMWLDEHKRVQGNIQTVLSYGITKDEQTEHEKLAQEREKQRHDEEMERLKSRQLDIQDKKAKGDQGEELDPEAEGLMGEDYLSFLQKKHPDMAGTVKQIGEGRAQMPSRLSKEGLKLRNMVNRVYGDWDESLGKEWPNVRKEYMVSGKSAAQATSYNALFRHMAELYDHTTAAGMVPFSDAYNQRQTDIAHVKEELAKSVSAGVMTEKDKDEFESKLLGTFISPEMKRIRIREAAQLAHDRMQEMQTKFESNKPSPEVKVPSLISEKGRQGLDYVVSGGKTLKPAPYTAGSGEDSPGQTPSAAGTPSPRSQQPAQQVQTPAGNKIAFKAPDNKTYYFDNQQQLDNFKKLAKIQ